MISQIMAYCNNHYVRSTEKSLFSIETDGIVGNFNEKYIVGQYIWIQGSFLSDGVYKIAGVTTSKLTLDETLTAEDTGEYIVIHGLNPPKDYLDLITDITTWVSKNGGKEGVASETIDSYSISYAGGAGGLVGNSWRNAFSSRLSVYKQMYETPSLPKTNYSYGCKGRGF